jgi:hypothetical protein
VLLEGQFAIFSLRDDAEFQNFRTTFYSEHMLYLTLTKAQLIWLEIVKVPSFFS